MNKKLKIALIVLVVIIAIGALAPEDKNQTPAPTNAPEQTTTPTNSPEQTETPKEEPVQTAEPTPEPTKEPEQTTYKASTYKVGSDIPAGEYVIFAESMLGYAEVSKDSSGELASIIANENFDYNTIFTLKEGQYFKMTGAYAIPIEQVTELDTTKSGMFKIGVHLPAGEYKVEVDPDNMLGFGYVEVSKKSTHNLNDIVTNDNFEGSKYITVKDGQYLKLSSAFLAN